MHLNLKFEIEKPETTPSGLSLSLLDFKVVISKDCNSSFEFYKKPAKKPLFVHHQSAIPTKSKLNFIRNERKRIKDRCSSNISTKQHLNTFDGILHLNGYPEKGIEQTKRPQNPQQTLNLPTQNGHTLRSLTFLNDSITGSLTFFEKKKKKENIPVRIAHKSYTLPIRQALCHTSKERKCTGDKCPISNTGLCLRRNAVNQLTCNSCDQQYIRSTTRFIRDRVREHLNNDNSSVKNISIPARTKTIKALMSRLL